MLSTYMEEKADFKEFREELEERRMKGITMDGKLWKKKFYQELFIGPDLWLPLSVTN